MNNRSLSRDADNIKSSVEDVIDNLISEIEDLEEQVRKLTDEIEESDNQINRLEDKVLELQEEIDQNYSDNYRRND